MRNREAKRKEGVRCRKLLLLAGFAALGLLAAAVPAGADPPLPIWCTTSGGTWRFDVLLGPCPVTSINPSQCAASGNYTGIKYKITGAADHVATVVTKYNSVVSVPGNQVYDPCVGDPITGIGKYSCHEIAIKVNPDQATQQFWLVVQGNKIPILQSIVAKKGSKTEACAIEGFGEDPPPETVACVPNCSNLNPEQTLTKTEILTFKGCSVEFLYDLTTGEVISAQLTADSPSGCKFYTATVDKLTLTLNLPGVGPLGLGRFGDGIISTGSDSCTTRVIGGRLYTWGLPCP